MTDKNQKLVLPDSRFTRQVLLARSTVQEIDSWQRRSIYRVHLLDGQELRLRCELHIAKAAVGCYLKVEVWSWQSFSWHFVEELPIELAVCYRLSPAETMIETGSSSRMQADEALNADEKTLLTLAAAVLASGKERPATR